MSERIPIRNDSRHKSVEQVKRTPVELVAELVEIVLEKVFADVVMNVKQ